jgi:tyrosine-protein kinase Etk/Wzc
MNETNNQNANPYPPVQGSNVAEQGHTVNVRFLFNKYILRHWYLYVYTLTLAMITAYFYNWYATPIYFSSSTVLIKDDKQKYNGDDLLAQLNTFNSEGGIENEIGIIRSRQLIYKALQELDFEKIYVLKGDVKTSELFSETPIRLVDDTLYPAAFNATMHLTVVDDHKYKLAYMHPSGEFVGYYLFGKTIQTKLGVFSFIKTDRFIDSSFASPSYEKRNFAIRLRPLDALTDQYQTGLKVDKVSKQASLLQISVQGAVPPKNEAFLNKLCNLYIQKGIEVKNEYAVNTLRFIDEQLQILTRDIDVNEASVEDFRVKRGITDLSIEATSYLEAVKNFDVKISETQVQLSFLDYLEGYVVKGKELTGNLSPASILINDALLQNLVIKLNELENRRKAQLTLAKSDNPLLVGLNMEIQNTRGSLLENIRSLRNGLRASLNEAITQKNAVQGKMRLLPGAQRELQSLLRGSNIKETLYSYLLTKRAETAILLASTTADNRIIDVARTFEKPLKPIKSLSYSIAIILGLIIPALIIYIRDIMNDKLNDRYDLERQTSIPILGMIGLSASKSSLVVTEKPNSHISEAFRSIRTNLQYFNPNKKQNVIMITSSISGEGKSFCSVNLAVMLSMSGRKTILVGCDLRKPKITVGFDFTSDTGLSNYLIGIANEKEIIQKSGATPNLDVILSGPKPPNPSELIISSRMDELFEYLKLHYDNIILDTPPIGLITDAMVLSKYSDIKIYIVRQGVTRRHHMNFINKLYNESKITNLCIIMNAMKANNRSYGYGYEYAYGYGYGYGYGYYEEDRSERGLRNTFKNILKSKKKKKA